MAYDPPIKMVEAPLFLGRTWTTPGVQLHDLDGTPWDQEPADSSLKVYSAESVVVPAGSFFAYGVGRDDAAPPMRGKDGSGYDVFGYRLGPAGRDVRDEATTWYADGVGVVQLAGSMAGQVHSLLAYGPAVTAETMTWGRVKRLFH